MLSKVLIFITCNLLIHTTVIILFFEWTTSDNWMNGNGTSYIHNLSGSLKTIGANKIRVTMQGTYFCSSIQCMFFTGYNNKVWQIVYKYNHKYICPFVTHPPPKKKYWNSLKNFNMTFSTTYENSFHRKRLFPKNRSHLCIIT